MASTAAGVVTIWDRGTYECHEMDRPRGEGHLARQAGSRADYGLFQTDGNNWMIHRIDPAPPGWEPLPELVRPMLATPGRSRPTTATGRYEFKWDGVRAVVYVDGGRVRDAVEDRPRRDDLLPRAAGPGRVARIAAGGPRRRDRRARRQGPAELRGPAASDEHAPSRTRSAGWPRRIPVTYMIFDLLHLDGHSALEVPYDERRQLLEGLELAGPHWATPPSETGNGPAS